MIFYYDKNILTAKHIKSMFGNEKVAKWLTSLIVSFLTSILLTQPLQVKTKIEV